MSFQDQHGNVWLHPLCLRISSSGSLQGSKPLSLALKEQLCPLSVGEPGWKYSPHAKANTASARSLRNGQTGAASTNKVSGLAPHGPGHSPKGPKQEGQSRSGDSNMGQTRGL